MASDEHEKLREIFLAARELSPEQRGQFLDSACGNGTALRQEIESLLANDSADTPPVLAPTARPGVVSPTNPLAESLLKSIGPYRLLEIIGTGGMGVVYKAEQRAPIRRTVAVKLIKLGYDSREVIARFESERQALARMDHPHIAKVLDAGTDDGGRPYFVMEYVPGHPITKYADENRLSIQQRLELMLQVCDAIGHAHAKSIIHRDIKAGNVLAYSTTDGPRVKVIDFGVAKALTSDRLTDLTFNTVSGQAIGTYENMSPEQADGSPDIDTRTDVYSLGVLLYELLSGSKPFDRSNLAKAAHEEVRRIIREDEPPRPSTQLSSLGDKATKIAKARQVEVQALTKQLKSELDWIPLMALRKERERRYATPYQLADDVRYYLEGKPLRAAPDSISYRANKFVRRNRGPIIVGMSLFIGLVVGIAGITIALIGQSRAKEFAIRKEAEALREKAKAESLRAEAQSSEAVATEQRRATEVEARRSAEVSAFLQRILFDPSDPASAGMKEPVGVMLQHAEASIPRTFPADPAIEAAVYESFGRTYENANNITDAERCYRTAVEICRSKVGFSSPQTIASIRDLAALLLNAKKGEEALQGLHEALAELQKSCPEDLRAEGLLQLCEADVLSGLDRKKEAMPLLKCTILSRIDAAMDVWPNLNPITLTEPLRSDPQLLALSAKEYAESLAEHTRIDGESANVTLVTAYLLADASLLSEDYVTARETFEWLLPRARSALGLDHRFIFYIVKGLTETLDDGNLQSEGDAVYENLVQARAKEDGADAPITLVTVADKLSRLERLGRYGESIPDRRSLLEMQRKVYGDSDPNTLASFEALGTSLLHSKTGQSEAMELFKSARQIAAVQFGETSKKVKVYDEELAEVADWGKKSVLHLQCTVTAVVGLAQYRSSPADPWRPAQAGVMLGDTAEFRNGPRSRIQLFIPPNQKVTLDRFGSMTLLEAVKGAGKSSTELALQQGRVRYDIGAPGVGNESMVEAPNGVLAVHE